MAEEVRESGGGMGAIDGASIIAVDSQPFVAHRCTQSREFDAASCAHHQGSGHGTLHVAMLVRGPWCARSLAELIAPEDDLSDGETDAASAKGCHSESLFNKLLYALKAETLLLMTSCDQPSSLIAVVKALCSFDL